MPDNVHNRSGEPPLPAEETPSLLKTDNKKWWKQVPKWIVVAGLVGLLVGACYKSCDRTEEKTTETKVVTTAELPDPFGLIRPGENIAQCEGAQDVRLKDDGSEHVTIPLRPCRSGYYTLPQGWSGFRGSSEPDEEVIIWDISGRRIDIPRGVSSKPIRDPGRTFQVAGPGGVLNLYPKKIGEGSQSQSSRDAALKETSGDVVQWVPEIDLLILKTESGEERFKANKNTRVSHGYKFYYLGSQGFFSSREGASLRPGDKVKIRFQPTDRYVITIDILKVSQPPSPDPPQEARVSSIDERTTERVNQQIVQPQEKVIRGKITEIDEATGKLSIENQDGPWSIVFSEETLVFIEGKECRIESLRIEDPVRIYFLEGSETVHRIEVGTPPDRRLGTNGLSWASYFPNDLHEPRSRGPGFSEYFPKQ